MMVLSVLFGVTAEEVAALVDGSLMMLITNSTRRFNCRPFSVVLLNMGFPGPIPEAATRLLDKPCLVNALEIASARCLEIAIFLLLVP